MPREEEVAQDTAQTELTVPDTAQVGALAIPTLAPEKYVAAVYQPFKDRLASAIDSVRAVNYDITTPAGMKSAITLRATFRDLRVEADKERKARKAPINQIGKLLESGFDGIEERIAPLEELFDTDIKAEEKRKADEKAERERLEAERVAAIRAKIDELLQLPAKYAGATGEKLNVVLAELSERPITAEIYAELLPDAQLAYDTAGDALLVMMNTALEREEAEALRLAKQEEERVRLAKQAEELERQRAAAAAEQAERDRVAAETKRQLAAQAAQVAAARLAQEQERARLQAEHEARERAIVDIRSIQQLGELHGTRQVVDSLQILGQMELEAEKFGSMLDMATMTRDMTVIKLEQRLAGYLAVELPVAHLEALEDNALFDAARNKMLATAPAPVETAFAAPIDWDAPAADLPLPESVSELDAALDAGEEIDVTDLWILDSVASELGVTRRQMLARFQKIDLLELSALVEAED